MSSSDPRAAWDRSDWCRLRLLGDYIFTASVGNKDLVTWADGRNGVPDTFFAEVKTD